VVADHEHIPRELIIVNCMCSRQDHSELHGDGSQN
jgi:hypothetical protein